MRRQLRCVCMMVLSVAAVTGCGVRGDPVPPGTPAEIGRGRPSYKRATEGIKFSEVPEYKAKVPSEDEEENTDRDDND